MDSRRLSVEIAEMKKLPGLKSFSLYEDTSYSKEDWRRYFWEGFAPTGHRVVAKYAGTHPYSKMDIAVDPDVNTHHKHGRDICYLRDSEWNANWTAATAILTAFRFLEDHAARRL